MAITRPLVITLKESQRNEGEEKKSVMKERNPPIVTSLPVLRIRLVAIYSKHRITIPFYGTINLSLPFYGTTICLSFALATFSRFLFCGHTRHHNFTPINADGRKTFICYVTNDRLRSFILQMLEQFHTREAEGSKREIIVSGIFMS